MACLLTSLIFLSEQYFGFLFQEHKLCKYISSCCSLFFVPGEIHCCSYFTRFQKIRIFSVFCENVDFLESSHFIKRVLHVSISLVQPTLQQGGLILMESCTPLSVLAFKLVGKRASELSKFHLALGELKCRQSCALEGWPTAAWVCIYLSFNYVVFVLQII